jgi:hypothetical protein
LNEFPERYKKSSSEDDGLRKFVVEEDSDGFLENYFNEGNVSEPEFVNRTTLK